MSEANDPTSPQLQGWVRVAQLAELGVLTASLLHELRQPLFAIRALSQLRRAQGRGLDEADLDTLLGSLRHVDELLDHYSGFSRIDGPLECFDARVAARQATAMLAHRAAQDGSTLKVQLCDEATMVRGRPTALRQVLVNLLQNAFDAVAGAPKRHVEVTVDAAGDRCRIEVADSGPGIDEAHREELFRPFFTTKGEGRGTGLGLFIARRLIEELGGSVALADTPNTRIVVSVPLVVD